MFLCRLFLCGRFWNCFFLSLLSGSRLQGRVSFHSPRPSACKNKTKCQTCQTTQSWSTCKSLASNLTLIHGSHTLSNIHLTSIKWVQSFSPATDKPCLPAIRVQTWEALRGPPGMANTPGKRHQQQQKIAMGRPASGKKQSGYSVWPGDTFVTYLGHHTKPLFRNCDYRW